MQSMGTGNRELREARPASLTSYQSLPKVELRSTPIRPNTSNGGHSVPQQLEIRTRVRRRGVGMLDPQHEIDTDTRESMLQEATRFTHGT